MLWAIYVSDKQHSRINFPIDIDQGIWGVKESKKDTVTNIKEGDLVAFVYSISWLKAGGRAPNGFSRVGKEQIHNFRGIVQNITIGKVTKAYYSSSSEVWPDDVYPHRFEFKIEYQEDSVYFGTEFFNEGFVEAVRYSACTQGSVTRACDIERLEQITSNIDEEQETEELESGYEGKPILRLHKSRERSANLVKQKKKQVIEKTGKLACEVCSIDFKDVYGELGNGFAECHHVNPLSLRDENKITELSDLAIVCSNCHRMLHRKRPWIKIETLKEIYEQQRP